jgi:hypothetical protein
MQSTQDRNVENNMKWRESFPREKANPFVKALSLFVAAAGLAVMSAWIFDIVLIKSIAPAFVSMKFSTAFAFVVSGISLYFLVRAREGEFEKAQVALSITSFILTILMGLLFFSDIFGIETGIENLFVRDPGDAKSVVAGMPSVPTMINFLLIALACIITNINPAELRPKLKTIGAMVGVIGLLAVAGYVFGAPLLYFFIPGVNSAMALHTAVLFVALGTGLLCL